MTLAAAQVIDGMAALVASANVGAVHTSRSWPLDESALPAWRLIADDEDIETIGANWPAQEQHELTVLAQGYARATSDLDDALHALAEAALAKLFQTSSTTRLSPLNCAMRLSGIRRDLVTEGEATLGRITLILPVRFLTFNSAPGSIV